MSLARLKPYNGKTHLLRSYTVGGRKFTGDGGWYAVDEELAAYLRGLKQRPGDDLSADAFDVCSEAEAKAIDASENKQTFGTVAQPHAAAPAAPPTRVHNVTRSEAAAAGTLTTADLPRASAPEPSGEFTEDMTQDPPAAPAAPAPAPSAPAGSTRRRR